LVVTRERVSFLASNAIFHPTHHKRAIT
jgi:hypothetical protein